MEGVTENPVNRPPEQKERTMKAVDILTSARDRFAANKSNWTTGTLARKNKNADDGKCFCSIGGVLNAGGGYDDNLDLVFGKLSNSYAFEGNMYCAGVGAKNQLQNALMYVSQVKSELNKLGFAAKTTLRAINYLQAAAEKMTGYRDAVGINDSGSDNKNYRRVLAMFDLAIKNAKRRHLNGGRVAVKAVPAF